MRTANGLPGSEGLVMMLAHCVNPDCCAPLRSFSEGRLYQFEIVSISIAASDSAQNPFDERPERRAVHYWLCGRCAATQNLELEPFRGLKVVPLAAQESHETNRERFADYVFKQGNRC